MAVNASEGSRIAMLSVEDAQVRGREHGIDDYISQLNLFRVLLNYPDIARELNNTIIALVNSDSALSHRLRELIIMRIAWCTRSEYEWTQHWQVCLLFGLSETEIVAVKEWRTASCFDESDKAVLQATDETLAEGAISAEAWAKLELQFADPAALIVVVASIGNWLMFSQLLRSLHIPLEDGAPSWPPDGRPPLE